jgi:hypothetical protein
MKVFTEPQKKASSAAKESIDGAAKESVHLVAKENIQRHHC